LGTGLFDALGEMFRADSTGGIRHAVHRLECPMGQDPSASTCEQQTEGKHRCHDQEKAMTRHVHTLQ
jgi:hypothetical protein